jgi:hypothetical protein
MEGKKLREMFLGSYTVAPYPGGWLDMMTKEKGGIVGFGVIAEHITGLEKKIEELSNPWNRPSSTPWEDRYYDAILVLAKQQTEIEALKEKNRQDAFDQQIAHDKATNQLKADLEEAKTDSSDYQIDLKNLRQQHSKERDRWQAEMDKLRTATSLEDGTQVMEFVGGKYIDPDGTIYIRAWRKK